MGEYSALALIMAYAAFAGGNGGLPVGGSRAMAERIAERYESLGGTLHLGKGISGLIRKGDRVCGAILDDGTRVGCDYVIFACDPYVTYSLLGQKMPKGLTKNAAAKKLPVYSSLQCAFVADGKAPFSDNVVIESKGYDDIPDRIILREFSHEAGFAPEGKNIIQVLIYIHDEQCDEWIGLRANDRATYRERKARMAAACADAIVRRYPELDGKLTLLDSWTPPPTTVTSVRTAERGWACSCRPLPSRDQAQRQGRQERFPGHAVATRSWRTAQRGHGRRRGRQDHDEAHRARSQASFGGHRHHARGRVHRCGLRKTRPLHREMTSFQTT